MFNSSSRIDQFLEAAAARQPTPGGGSIAALAGALGAAAGEMVIQYSLGKKSLEAYQDELRPALAELTRARMMLTQLMVEDQEAYEAVTALQKLPQDDPQRQNRLDEAILTAIRVPQAMAAVGVGMLEVCDRIVNFVNPRLLSDLAVCADLSMALMRCGQYNVQANLSMIQDADVRQRIKDANNQVLSRGATLTQQIFPRIWSRAQ